MRGLAIYHAIFAVILLVLLVPLANSAQTPPTQPAAADVSALIDDLASADSRTRDDAERQLWDSGPAAVQQLRSAAESENPEVAIRARKLLLNIQIGLQSDSPPRLLELMREYRGAPRVQKEKAVEELRQMGPVGSRVLCWLWLCEPPETRSAIFTNINYWQVHGWAAQFIGDGSDEVVEKLIRQMAGSGEDHQARDAVAYYFLQGTLAAHINETRKRFDARESKEDGTFLVYAYRAMKDAKSAAAIAGRGSDNLLQANLAAERGDWVDAQAKWFNTPNPQALPDNIPLRAAFARMSGNRDQYKDLTDRLDHQSLNSEQVLKAYFLNDQPTRGMAALSTAAGAQSEPDREESEYLALLCEQTRFADAFKFSGVANKLELRSMLPIARRLYTFGARKKAMEIFDALAANAVSTRYPGACAKVSMALHEVGDDDRAKKLACDTLSAIGENEDCFKVAQPLVPTDVKEAALWWELLRQMQPDDPPQKRLDRLLSLFNAKLPADEVRAIIDNARQFTVPGRNRDSWNSDIIRLTAQEGLDDARLEQYAGPLSGSQTFQTLGDMLAGKEGQWERAALAYERAWQADRKAEMYTPLNLALWGNALRKAGHVAEGQARVDRAHVMLLAGDGYESYVVQEFRRRGIEDDAQRQEDIALRTDDFDGFMSQEVTARRAEKLALTDPTAAAALNEGRLFHFLKSNLTFLNASGFIEGPKCTHLWRAQGAEQRGDIETALGEWRICLEYTPVDADVASGIVRLLDKSGRGKEADAIYAPIRDALKTLAADYPDSPAAHNNLAWLTARCRRDLDLALAESIKANELEPKSAAYIDTLAEVHLARGDAAGALKLMYQAVELAPDVPILQARLKEFESAK